MKQLQKVSDAAALAQMGNGFPATGWAEPSQLDDEKLAALVADGAVKLALFSEALKPYYLELRERFRNKKSKSASIHGCATWDDYCEKVLDRTRRAINYWLAGGNPTAKRKAGIKSQTSTGGTPTPENGGKPLFAIAHSPIDGDAEWSKQDASRRILTWSLSCLKNFSPTEKREIAEDVTAKLRDEMMFEEPEPLPDPEPSSLEALRQTLARMADVEDIEKTLNDFVTDLLTPVLVTHPHDLSYSLHVAVHLKDARNTEKVGGT
jgi:hypothetical protein